MPRPVLNGRGIFVESVARQYQARGSLFLATAEGGCATRSSTWPDQYQT